MITFGRLGKAAEPSRRPVEISTVNDYTADRRAVTADPLGSRMNDNVGAVLDRSYNVSSGTECVVYNKGAWG